MKTSLQIYYGIPFNKKKTDTIIKFDKPQDYTLNKEVQNLHNIRIDWSEHYVRDVSFSNVSVFFKSTNVLRRNVAVCSSKALMFYEEMILLSEKKI